MSDFPMSFESNFEEHHITAIVEVEGVKIGLRFESAAQVFEMFSRLMKNAVEVWPNDPIIKDYLEDE